MNKTDKKEKTPLLKLSWRTMLLSHSHSRTISVSFTTILYNNNVNNTITRSPNFAKIYIHAYNFCSRTRIQILSSSNFNHFLCLFQRKRPKPSQRKNEIYPAYHRTALRPLSSRWRYSNYLLGPFDVEEPQLYSETLLYYLASDFISKAESIISSGGALYSWAEMFGLYPQLMTVSEGCNIDWPVNGQLLFWFSRLLSWQQNTKPLHSSVCPGPTEVHGHSCRKHHEDPWQSQSEPWVSQSAAADICIRCLCLNLMFFSIRLLLDCPHPEKASFSSVQL